MVRKLKYHEQKLLKKVDFISWKADNNLHEVKVLKKYHVQKREDYTKYNKLCRSIRELARKIKEVDSKHPFRTESSAQLLEKLYLMGLIPTRWDLSLAEKVTASGFCRRRLPVVMVRNKMSETIKGATKLIEQGHVRIGPELVKDPALLVTRNLEDFVTWVDNSKIRKHVLEYNGRRLTKANVEYNPFTEEEKAQTETEKSFQQLLESNPDAADHFYSRKQLKQKLEDREHRLNSLQFNNFTNKLHVIAVKTETGGQRASS
ncbi:Ribosomal protein S4/S9 N-terminal domain [Popillia japonica]|uniref:U3 small nucleolar ribonucleoprotein protein IMP3 n=1 Tax=Popillia japonica TaxID=7064 RepID=A0AAW1IG60_POPJA